MTMLDDRQTAAPWPTAYPQGYAVVDVETTGLARDDRIVSAAVYRLDARGNVEDHWYTLVNPQRDPGPVWIHGLTSEVLDGAPLFPEVAAQLSERLADRVLVAHNAAFDWSMLAREYARASVTAPVEQRLCTIALSKELRLPLPNHKLESLAAHFGVVQQRAHHALDDARVLAEAFRPSLHAAARGGVRLPLLESPAADRVVGLPGRPADRLPALVRSGQLASLAKASGVPVSEPRAVREGQTPHAGHAGGVLRGHLRRPRAAGGPGRGGRAARGDQRVPADQSARHQ